jgi:hypothetical protein
MRVLLLAPVSGGIGESVMITIERGGHAVTWLSLNDHRENLPDASQFDIAVVYICLRTIVPGNNIGQNRLFPTLPKIALNCGACPPSINPTCWNAVTSVDVSAKELLRLLDEHGLK